MTALGVTMADLQALAKQKAEAERQKLLVSLPGEIQALQRQLAAKGSLASGAMLKQVLAVCQEAITKQGKSIASEYQWAVNHSLFASQSWVERLVADGPLILLPLYDAAVAQVSKATQIAGMPSVTERLLSDLAETRSVTEADVALALRSAFAEKHRGLIRSLPSSLLRLILKPFTGGTP